MENIAANFIDLRLSPAPKSDLHGQEYLQVELRWTNATPVGTEIVALTVFLKAGDHNLSAIRDQALVRASQILASANKTDHQLPSSEPATQGGLGN